MIHNTYKDKSAKFFEKRNYQTLTEEDKWKELIYCILAGTQVTVEVARKAQVAALKYKKCFFSSA